MGFNHLLFENDLCARDLPFNDLFRELEIKIRNRMVRKSPSAGLVPRKILFFKQQCIKPKYSCTSSGRGAGGAATYDNHIIHKETPSKNILK